MTADNRKPNGKVGFGKPPLDSRFKPGQSGNPSGRPKGTRNLRTDVRDTLQAPVKVADKGRPRRISTQQAVLMRLREKALNGDARSLDRLLEYARVFNNDVEAAFTDASIAVEDQAILDAYAEQIRTAKDAGSSGK
jgi:Family of unknown function (DUF5681)